MSSLTASSPEYTSWRDLAIKMCMKCGEQIKADIMKRQIMELESAATGGNINYSAVSIKSNVADLVTQTDQEVEKMIKQMIQEHFPSHKFVGEETSAEMGGHLTLTDDPTWVVDPIDGTTNFVHKYPGSCISIGVLHNQEPVVGVVYDIVGSSVYWGVKGMGAYKMGENIPLKATDCGELEKCLLLTEATSRRDPESIQDITKTISNLLNAGLQAMRFSGSAAMNLCRVASGCADGYYEIGPHIWDVAAGAVILSEAGGCLLNPKTLEKANLCDRQFLGVGRNSCLASLIGTHIENTVQLESD